jgi:hypothetical protein
MSRGTKLNERMTINTEATSETMNLDLLFNMAQWYHTYVIPSDRSALSYARGVACIAEAFAGPCASRKHRPRLFGGLRAHTARRQSWCNPLRTGTAMSLPRLGQAGWGRAFSYTEVRAGTLGLMCRLV